MRATSRPSCIYSSSCLLLLPRATDGSSAAITSAAGTLAARYGALLGYLLAIVGARVLSSSLVALLLVVSNRRDGREFIKNLRT